MSGSRGRKITANRPGGSSRWSEHQQTYYNQNASIPDLRYLNTWNGRPLNSYNDWQHNSNLHTVWPPHHHHNGYFAEDHHPRSGSFDNFQHRLPHSFNPPNHFAERSLAHLNQTPLNELTSGIHSGSRDLATPRESSSAHNKQPVSTIDTQCVQTVRNKVTETAAAGRSRIPSRGSQQESSNPRSIPGSGAEKQSVPAKSTSFMPPNDDLRNKVKASLEKFAAAKDHAPSKKNSSTVKPPLPLSPQKVRESRVPNMEALPSPSSRYAARVGSGSQRRISQSSSNPAVNNDATINPLAGIGFIQNTSSENSNCADQTSQITSATVVSGSDVPVQETEPLTTIPKDQLNKYIRSMDNHQRRQLVEQPRAIISQYMLNHLVQENQTARARQLSSLRFRVSSNELELSSRTETSVILSEELVDEFKELLSRDDDETVVLASTSEKPDSEDEDIQVLEPPPKEPPLCIDLDQDDKSSPDCWPCPVTPLVTENPVPIQQDKKESTSSQVASTTSHSINNLVSTELAPTCPLTVSSRQAVASTEARPFTEVSVQTSIVTETVTVTRVPCLVPVSVPPVSRCNPASAITAPVQLQSSQSRPTSSASSATPPPGITTTVSAGKKSFLDKPSKNKKRKEKRDQMKNAETMKIPEKPKTKKQKKNKRKTPMKSPVKTNAELMIHWRQAQSISENTMQAEEPDKSKRVVSALERAESLEKGPDSGRTKSALNFLFTDLRSEEQEGKDRIELIDRKIEELQLERKALTDKVLALKQKQFDLLRSAMTSNTFDDVSESGPSQSVPAAIKAPTAPETAKDEHKVVEDKAISGDPSAVQTTPPVASIQLLSLMHQLEENGVQVNLGEVELAAPSDPNPSGSAVTSLGNKRKRRVSDDSKQPNKKGTPTSSPLRNTSVAQTVEKPDQVPSNSLLIHPLQSNNTPNPLQTLSVNQINQISSTISTVIAKSVEPSCAKKATSPLVHAGQSKKETASESSIAAESQTLSNATSTAKSHSASSVKTAESKKATTIQEKTLADKVVPNTSQPAEKETNVITSRPADVVRTYSRRDDSINQKSIPKPPHVNVQGSGTTAKALRSAGSNPVNDPAATRPAGMGKAVGSPKPSEVAPPPSPNVASSSDSCNSVLLRSHQSSVRCVFICGPCAFTSSEDGTVHIYDLLTNSLSMRILGHTKPVTWLYAASLSTPSEVLKTIKYTTEYLNHLTLITGSEDAHIRQFSLDSGALLHEKSCDFPLTCVVGHKLQSKLYVGTTEGTIYTYTPKLNALRTNRFKANAEIIFMKILVVRGKRAIIVAARRMDPVIYDLETEEALCRLTSNIPSSSFYSITTAAHFVFCCDANKNVFKFDTNSDNPLCQTDTLPSAAVSSFHDGKRYLVLGCMDGVIRVLDTTQKSPRFFALPGQALKTLTCMKVVGDRIVGGSLSGEVAYCRLPNLEALSKSQPQM